MNINEQTVEYIAKLAMLNMSPEERKKFIPQLNEIIHYIEKLNELDTESISPTASVIPIKNVLREDKLEHSLPQKDFLPYAPDAVDNFFKVPPII